MIDKNVVFKKSEPGREEIAKPISETMLPRELRSLLILIDGKKNFGLYDKALANTRIVETHGSVDQCFNTLMDLGFIDSSGLANKSSSATSKKPAPEVKDLPLASKTTFVPDDLTISLPEEDDLEITNLRSSVIECIEMDLGASSWEVLLDIERAQSLLDLKKAIEQIVKLHKSAFSNESKRTLNDIYKKLKKLKDK